MTQRQEIKQFMGTPDAVIANCNESATLEAETKAFIQRLYHITPFNEPPAAVAAAEELTNQVLKIFEMKS